MAQLVGQAEAKEWQGATFGSASSVVPDQKKIKRAQDGTGTKRK
jgi:hypothetical protein